MEWNGLWGGLKKWLQVLENKVGGQGRNRTADASLFRAGFAHAYRIHSKGQQSIQRPENPVLLGQ